jgi:hypothetical protein
VRLFAAVIVAGVLGVPSAALAQGGGGNALTPGLPQSQAPTPTTAAPPSSANPPITMNPTSNSGGSSSGLTGTAAVAIAIGAVVVLGGISYFIWWDARKRAPKRGHLATASAGLPGRRAGSKAPPKPRKLSPAERRRRKRGRAR